MRHCLIYNPQAGTADRLKEFILQLKPEHRCELWPTFPQAGAKPLARKAIDEGFDRIIAAGGDGTISQVVNGIAPDFDAVELAVLPMGTGNDLARSLGPGPDQFSAACRTVFGGTVAPIDVMQIECDGQLSWCVNVANGGLGGQVAADVHSRDKQRWGALAYWMTSVSHLIDLPVFDVQMELDDVQMELQTVGIAVANGRFVGGGFPIAPGALLNDGVLDVTVVPVLPTHELMAAGLNSALGRNRQDSRVRHHRAHQVHLRSTPEMPFSIDGELVRPLDATFRVIPSVLRVVVGDEPQAVVMASETDASAGESETVRQRVRDGQSVEVSDVSP